MVASTVIIALLAIIIAVQIVFFIIALTLYFLTTKRFRTCCGGDITGQPSNIRVSITLMSAIGLGGILLVILFFAGVAMCGTSCYANSISNLNKSSNQATRVF